MTTKPIQKIYDISPIISKDIAVFPGDTPFQRDILMSFENKNHLLLSTIKSTVHLGAHADAPNHYDPSGCGIGERDLHFYVGPCQVISVDLPPKARIKRDDFKNINIKAPRVLFKTGSFDNPNQWNDNFNSLSPELIDWLAEKQVILVGIDTPSVDPADSKELDSHHTIFKNNFAILEGLLLKNISDGLYELIALPLKIKDADASPVRAILIKNKG